MLYIITVKARFNGTLGEGIKPGKSRGTVKRGIFYINFKVYKCINLAYWGKIEASKSRDTINQGTVNRGFIGITQRIYAQFP